VSLIEDLLKQVGNPSPEFKALLEKVGAEHPDELAEAVDAVWVPNPGPQTAAYFSPADELLYGGEAGGGKSDLLLGLPVTAHDRSLVLRRINGDAVKLVERVEAIVGHRNGYNGQLQRWRLDGRLIELRGCEQEADKQRFKGDPHDFIGFDELCDFLESQYRFIIGWNRSAKPGQRCRVVGATNPPTTASGLWVFKYWAPWLDPNHPNPAKPGELRWYTTVNGVDTEVDGPGPHEIEGEAVPVMARSRSFIPSTLEDNPDLAATNYRSVLAALPDGLRRAYRDGDWSVGQRDDDWQAIPTAWIEAAQARWTPKPPRGVPMTAMAVDVAPGGGDRRVICWRHGGWFGPFDAKREVDKTGRRTAADVIYHRRGNCPVVVDLGGGWGGDAVIALKDNGVVVVAFNGVETTTERQRGGKLGFRNKRSAAVWRFREALDPSQEGGSVVALPPDAELKAELASYRYENTHAGILVRPKEEQRELLGQSPDKGDGAVMCLSEGAKAAERIARAGRTATPMVANTGGRQMASVRR